MKTNCLICGGPFELANRMFEQRLIDDTDFCPKCFKEFLDTDMGEIDYSSIMRGALLASRII